ncbi:MAG: hypothetical protein DSY80_05290 [Desulfocapsa sp.]|nr:MAG: hypothetical protein DSY80_05290 [Desulfocapsa sp.]
MKKILFFLSILLFAGTLQSATAAVPTMSKDELKSHLSSDKIVILDVRTGRDWSSSEFMIQGAIRAAGSDIADWSKNYTKDQTLVLYCA